MIVNAPIIVKCDISPYPISMPYGKFDQMPEVKVKLNNGEELILFKFYPDEITINESELIGLSVEQAKRIKFEKEVRSLQY
jgi:hypothetical protein